MNLNATQCPFDGEMLTLTIGGDGSLLVVCGSCHAAWEPDGSFVEPRQPREAATRVSVRV